MQVFTRHNILCFLRLKQRFLRLQTQYIVFYKKKLQICLKTAQKTRLFLLCVLCKITKQAHNSKMHKNKYSVLYILTKIAICTKQAVFYCAV